jgi:hypothetical protein
MSKREFLEVFGFLMAQEFAQSAPKDTGNLARSFPGTLQVKEDVISYTLPEYAKFVEFGTRPHIILPKNKTSLKFKVAGGQEILTKRVEHPGTRPNPFIRDTFNRKAEDNIKKSIKILMERE